MSGIYLRRVKTCLPSG